MVTNRYQQAADSLRRASRLGQRPVTPPRHADTGRSLSPGRASAQSVPSSGDRQPHQPPQVTDHNDHQATRYRPSPVSLGFGLGLGFAAGGAVFRLIVFIIGVGLLFLFFQAGIALVGL